MHMDTPSANSCSETSRSSGDFQSAMLEGKGLHSDARRSRPTVAELTKMNINGLRRLAVSMGVSVTSGSFYQRTARSKAEILQDVVRKCELGVCGDMSFVCSRPAPFFASSRDSGMCQRMLNQEAVLTLAKLRDMNCNKLRHVASLNGVRQCLRRSDGCTKRTRSKAEILQDLEHKLEMAGPLLVEKKRPNSKDLVAQYEAEGKNRTEIRAALRKHGFSYAVIYSRTKHVSDGCKPSTPTELQAITHTGQLRAAAANLGLSIRDGKGRAGKLRTKSQIISAYKSVYDGVKQKVEEFVAIKSTAEFRKRAVKLGLHLRNSRQKMRTKAELIKDYERKLIAAGQKELVDAQCKTSATEYRMRSGQQHT